MGVEVMEMGVEVMEMGVGSAILPNPSMGGVPKLKTE
jgi:hypothetical protein